MYGSMLCLSQDGFDKNNLFAVIANRKNEDMAEGMRSIKILVKSCCLLTV